MGKKKILAIDDEEDFLAMVKINLEDTGEYEVDTLNDPKRALDELHRFNPDVILLDMIMPSLGGIDVCEMLNNDPVGLKTPIIVLSALSKEKDKLKAYKVGVVGYLEKPVEKKDLINAIEKALKYK